MIYKSKWKQTYLISCSNPSFEGQASQPNPLTCFEFFSPISNALFEIYDFLVIFEIFVHVKQQKSWMVTKFKINSISDHKIFK
jgi:hypothetical protein